MTHKEHADQLAARVKVLAKQHDEILRKAGSEEQKLNEACEKLRALGIQNPENMTEDDLERLLTKFEGELVTAVTQLEADVTEGERLLASV